MQFSFSKAKLPQKTSICAFIYEHFAFRFRMSRNKHHNDDVGILIKTLCVLNILWSSGICPGKTGIMSASVHTLALAAPWFFIAFPLCWALPVPMWKGQLGRRGRPLPGPPGLRDEEREEKGKQTLIPQSRMMVGLKRTRVCTHVWDPLSVLWTTWLSLLALESLWAMGSRQSQCAGRALRGAVMLTQVSVLSTDASACLLISLRYLGIEDLTPWSSPFLQQLGKRIWEFHEEKFKFPIS